MLPEELKKQIGTSAGDTIFEIDRETIRRYAEAIDDSNPLYWDEEYAKKTKYGTIIAPPGFMFSPWFSGRGNKKWVARQKALSGGPLVTAMTKAGFTGILDGSIEWEELKPARAGDTIRGTRIVKDISVREMKAGKMAFATFEVTFTNQDDEVICIGRILLIHPSARQSN